LIGGLILQRPSIFSRATFFRPEQCWTSRTLSAALACLLSCLSPAQAEPLKITLAISDEGGAYRRFSESLLGKLQGDRYAVKIKRAEDALGGADLYIAVGMKASTQLAGKDIPTLNVFVPRSGYDKLQRESVSRVSSRSVIYLDQPMERQIALLLAALPNVRRVGALYTVTSPELQSLRRLLAEKKIDLYDHGVDQNHSLNEALEKTLGESEVLFVLPDADIYNASTIRNILLTSYRKQIPLVGISQAYVKAGALCAVFSTPEQVATQVHAMIEQYAESGRMPAAQYPNEFEVSVNIQVARSLDLRVKDAAMLHDEIRRIP
jgi:putative tryptophan/tyrosine transport system substrate-binding protein